MAAAINVPHRPSLLIRIAVAALATAALLLACDRTERKHAGPPEKITIAYATVPETTLAQVAQAQGYFREEGLEVTAHLHAYGKPAFEEMLAGTADFSTVAETPVMFAVMQGKQIAVIATIQTSSLSNAILARKDRGILNPGNLRGKRIAATLGTSMDFYLDAVLTLHNLSRKEVEVVDLKVGEMADALERGDIDAVSTFTHYKAIAQKRLGAEAITFQDKETYRETFNVVATQEYIRNHPETIKKMVRALVRTEDYVREHPAEAQQIVSDFSGIERAIVNDLWSESRFEVTLDQPLILALEDESRWAIKTGLTGAKEVPNYLDSIYFDGLKAIKPEAVSILR